MTDPYEPPSILLFSPVKIALFRIVEIGAALIGVILILYLLLGEDSNPYIDSVITNLSYLVEKISPQAKFFKGCIYL